MKGHLTLYERRESIKALLMRERSTTTMRLVYMFGVTRQTIQRDIVFLSSRLPIITKAGNGGGIFLEARFEAPKEYLTFDEEVLLRRLSEKLCDRDKLIMNNILNKFTVS